MGIYRFISRRASLVEPTLVGGGGGLWAVVVVVGSDFREGGEEVCSMASERVVVVVGSVVEMPMCSREEITVGVRQHLPPISIAGAQCPFFRHANCTRNLFSHLHRLHDTFLPAYSRPGDGRPMPPTSLQASPASRDRIEWPAHTLYLRSLHEGVSLFFSAASDSLTLDVVS